MLKTHTRPEITSSSPIALATLTSKDNKGNQKLVEWTSVRYVRWTRTGRRYVRHILKPILKKHIGLYGLELNLLSHDVGRRLVVDIPVERLPGESEYDMHVEG